MELSVTANSLPASRLKWGPCECGERVGDPSHSPESSTEYRTSRPQSAPGGGEGGSFCFLHSAFHDDGEGGGKGSPASGKTPGCCHEGSTVEAKCPPVPSAMQTKLHGDHQAWVQIPSQARSSSGANWQQETFSLRSLPALKAMASLGLALGSGVTLPV